MCTVWWLSDDRFVVVLFVFFKQKTAYEMRISDWSSDVCSSDLRREADEQPVVAEFPRSALTVAGAEPAGLRGARLARHRDAVERQAAAHRGARAIDDEVHALARDGERFG